MTAATAVPAIQLPQLPEATPAIPVTPEGQGIGNITIGGVQRGIYVVVYDENGTAMNYPLNDRQICQAATGIFQQLVTAAGVGTFDNADILGFHEYLEGTIRTTEYDDQTRPLWQNFENTLLGRVRQADDRAEESGLPNRFTQSELPRDTQHLTASVAFTPRTYSQLPSGPAIFSTVTRREIDHEPSLAGLTGQPAEV